MAIATKPPAILNQNVQEEVFYPTDAPDDVYYPSENDEPMAATDTHADHILYFRSALKERYGSEPKVYVASDNLLYYQRGDANKVCSPDCYVVFGVDNHPREKYLVWEEGGHVPNVVFEFTSSSTKDNDLTTKRLLFERLGIQEYFLFDPSHELLNPNPIGFRLVDGYYVPIPLENGTMYSEQLDIDLVQVEGWLRIFDRRIGGILPDYRELSVERTLEKLRADEEARLRTEAELRADEEARLKTQAELRADEEARLRTEAELRADEEARLKTEAEGRAIEEARLRTEAERRAIEEAKLKTEEARLKTEALAEVERLKAVLERLGGRSSAT